MLTFEEYKTIVAEDEEDMDEEMEGFGDDDMDEEMEDDDEM